MLHGHCCVIAFTVTMIMCCCAGFHCVDELSSTGVFLCLSCDAGFCVFSSYGVLQPPLWKGVEAALEMVNATNRLLATSCNGILGIQHLVFLASSELVLNSLCICLFFYAGFRFVDYNGVLQPPLWKTFQAAQNLVDVTNKFYNGSSIQ